MNVSKLLFRVYYVKARRTFPVYVLAVLRDIFVL